MWGAGGVEGCGKVWICLGKRTFGCICSANVTKPDSFTLCSVANHCTLVGVKKGEFP